MKRKEDKMRCKSVKTRDQFIMSRDSIVGKLSVKFEGNDFLNSNFN